MIKCDYCGRENPDDAFNCSGCAGELKEEPLVIKQTKAGFWIRFCARVTDQIILFVLAFILGVIVGVLISIAGKLGWIPSDWQAKAGRHFLLSILFALLGNIAYHAVCEGIHGATLGKLCFGIRVVCEDSKPPNLLAAFVRSIAIFIDGLFFGAVAYSSMIKSPLNQRYGDHWAKTVVLKADEIPLESQQSTARLCLALALGLLLYSFLESASILLQIF